MIWCGVLLDFLQTEFEDLACNMHETRKPKMRIEMSVLRTDIDILFRARLYPRTVVCLCEFFSVA